MSETNLHPSQPQIPPAMAAPTLQDPYGRVVGTVDTLSITLDKSRQLVLIPQALHDIAANLATQDNRMTNNPIFLVQKKVRQTALDLNYCDNYIWLNCANDHDEVTDPAQIERLEELEGKYSLTDKEEAELSDYIKTGYIDHWETLQPFFTEAAAQQFIDSIAHRHDLGTLRVYVESAYQNTEWQAIRNFLLFLNETNPSSTPAAPTTSTPTA